MLMLRTSARPRSKKHCQDDFQAFDDFVSTDDLAYSFCFWYRGDLYSDHRLVGWHLTFPIGTVLPARNLRLLLAVDDVCVKLTNPAIIKVIVTDLQETHKSNSVAGGAAVNP